MDTEKSASKIQALHRAVAQGQWENTRDCLDAGVSVDARHGQGRTALMEAARCGQAECVGRLLAAGAEVDAHSNDKKTALVEAVGSCKTECVRLLLAAGADVDSADQTGRTVLMCSVLVFSSGFELDKAKECMSLLIGSGCDLDARDHEGDSALDYARARGIPEAMELIASEIERRALDDEVVGKGLAPSARRL